MSPSPTLLNDRYEVDDLIGRGGMADVHRAYDTVLERTVAVKILRDASAADDAARFAHEARLLAALDHPHIVRLLDAGVAEDRPWIVLELVEGTTLREMMGETPLDVESVTRVGRDIASALAHAHAGGVVHRDVKPGNILIAADGTAKLTDFGIAKLADSTASMTLSGHTIGTAAYLSPEQVKGEKVTGAGDVYALGLVLLEALTAVRAYPGTPVESAVSRLSVSPLIPTSLPSGWPSLIATMTAMEPTERPSAVDVALRLESPAPAVPVVQDQQRTHALPVLTPGHRPGAHRARRRGGLVAAAAVVLLVAGSIALAQGPITDGPSVADPTASTPSPTTSPGRPAAATPTPTPTATPVSMVTTSLDAVIEPEAAAPTEAASTVTEVKKNKQGKKGKKSSKASKASEAGKKARKAAKAAKTAKPAKSAKGAKASKK